MLIAIFALTFAASALLVNYLSQRELHPARRRILESAHSGDARPQHLQGSLVSRTVSPTVRSFGDFLGRLLPTNIGRSVEMLLRQAGNPITFQNFLTLWFLVAA